MLVVFYVAFCVRLRRYSLDLHKSEVIDTAALLCELVQEWLFFVELLQINESNVEVIFAKLSFERWNEFEDPYEEEHLIYLYILQKIYI